MATRVLSILLLLALAAAESGCGTACGPIRTVPGQRLLLMATSPDSYTISVKPSVGEAIQTPVPPDGRVAFEVPVTARDSTFLFFLIPVYHYPAPDTFRVISVMRGDQTVSRLSAREIMRLPADANGYHMLEIKP